MFSVPDIESAAARLAGVVLASPLQYSQRLSEKYNGRVWLKREDLQPVRSYKIRGAYHKIVSLPEPSGPREIVCASAGNHAQGVAYSCQRLGMQARIFMPANTPSQKIERVRALGKNFVTLVLTGETYDAAADAANRYAQTHQLELIHPFDDPAIISGQGTVGLEILKDLGNLDFLFLPVGGGGLAAGVGSFFKQQGLQTRLIGVEPAGAASMTAAFEKGRPVKLETINPFVDGAAVSQVGDLTFQLCQAAGLEMTTLDEGKVCGTLLELYNEDGIVAEPAGALAVAALENYAEQIAGKDVVCIISGGNNDFNRMEEIKKLAYAAAGWQHHLVIRFPHHPDGLKVFFTEMLGPDDYVNKIEYDRRDHGRSTYALLGVRCKSESGYQALTQRLRQRKFEFREIGKEDFLFKYWV